MILSLTKPAPKSKGKPAKGGRRTAYTVSAPLTLEQCRLTEASRQIETLAYSLADQVPATVVAELLELSAIVEMSSRNIKKQQTG